MLQQSLAIIVAPEGYGKINIIPFIVVFIFAALLYIFYWVLTRRKTSSIEGDKLNLESSTLFYLEDFLSNAFMGEQIQVGVGQLGEDVTAFVDDSLLGVKAVKSEISPTLELTFQKLGKVIIQVKWIDNEGGQLQKYSPLFEWNFKTLVITYCDGKILHKKLLMKLAEEVDTSMEPSRDG